MFRPAQYARGGAFDHICAAGTLLRSIAASVFLAGNVWSVIVPNTLVLAAMAILLAISSRAVMRKRLN